ncbi:MAG TPA: diaminopimelate decarboxylase [Mycobacteriales bacterium]|nr:diaminopimelate decarboxylase [Mycobacteriales bacterium]
MRTHEAGVLHADASEPPSSLLAPPADAAALVPAVWPVTTQRGGDGALVLGGVDVRDLAATHGTPAYVLDEADFRSRCRDFVQAFGDPGGSVPSAHDVHYAAKAFCCLAVLRWVAEEGLGLDVCTGGELAAAVRAGVPPERIAVHGNNKSVAELERALDAGVGRVVVDSFAEIARLAWLAEQRGRRQPVLVRATVGVEAHTHEFIATAHEDQKFGFSLASGDAFEAARRVVGHSSLELAGVHSHIGSQIFDTSGFEVSAHRAVGLLVRIRDELGLEPPYLDLGGGFGIAYTEADDPMDVPALAASMRSIVARESAAAGLAMPRLAVEPGRAIAGPATVTLYEVGTVKDTQHRRYVSVDGGMSDNIRTALYDAHYTCVLASRVAEEPPVLCRVVGKHCESGDIVVRDSWLPADLAPGDLVAVAATGAYCRSMASNYNHVPRPPVVAVAGGTSRVLVRRETEDDLFRLDVLEGVDEADGVDGPGRLGEAV